MGNHCRERACSFRKKISANFGGRGNPCPTDFTENLQKRNSTRKFWGCNVKNIRAINIFIYKNKICNESAFFHTFIADFSFCSYLKGFNKLYFYIPLNIL